MKKAPEAGIEPATNALTVHRSTAELLRKAELLYNEIPFGTQLPSQLILSGMQDAPRIPGKYGCRGLRRSQLKKHGLRVGFSGKWSIGAQRDWLSENLFFSCVSIFDFTLMARLGGVKGVSN